MRILTAIAIALAASSAWAEDIEEGAALFAAHCAGCHGIEAQGDGPISLLLNVAPTDLTGLAARNGGDFPTARVVQRVDGTTEVMAHGDPMPVFGLLLQGPSDIILAPDGNEVVAPENIINIAAWLEGLQK